MRKNFFLKNFCAYIATSIPDNFLEIKFKILKINLKKKIITFFQIQIAAIKCFSAIMQFDVDVDISADEMKIISTCRNELYKVFKTESENEKNESKGTAFYIQLFTSLFCANFHLRKPMIFQLAKLFQRQELSENLALKCFAKILKFLKCEGHNLMDVNSLLYLLSKWIIKGFSFNKSPWYFSGCISMEAFLTINYRLLSLAILKNKLGLIYEFVQNMADSENIYEVKDAISEVLTDCIAFMIPVEANCKTSAEYKEKTKILQQKINEDFNKIEQDKTLLDGLPQIIIKILGNIIDDKKFQEISGFWFEYHQQNESIGMVEYEQCMKYLISKCQFQTEQSLITFLCFSNKKYVEQLFMLQRSRIQSTELKEHKIMYLLQYCILVESTFEYMNNKKVEKKESIKEFIIREIVSYLGYLIRTRQYGQKIRVTSANFLYTYLMKILPNCVEEFKLQMNRVMSDILTIVQESNENFPSLHLKCFEIMNFLVLQQPSLSDIVAMLDRFPADNEFAELRLYQQEIKYNQGDFNLVDEINHFLSVKKRGAEGIREISEHLAAKKADLKFLFENIPQDGSNGLIHKLIRALVDYIQVSSDEKCAIEAIKCLGEIGSHNLSKIIFNEDDTSIYEKVENIQQCQKLICFKILDNMENLLLDHNHQVFETASNTCHYIFSKTSSDEYPESPFFRPFKGNCEKSNIHLFYLEPKIDKSLVLDQFFEKNKTAVFSNWLQSLCILIMNFAGKIFYFILKAS